MDARFLFACFWFLLCFDRSISLRCYKCTANEPESDCETEAENLSPTEYTMQCKPYQKYCTIRRVELNRRRGKVLNFYRSCETIPDFINKVITDDTYTTFFAACQQDLCNKGDGTTIVVSEETSNHQKPPLPSFEQLKWGIDGATVHANNFVVTVITLIAVLFVLKSHS